MSGRQRSPTSGQLALMDALVFFAVALLISSIVVSQAHLEGQNRGSPLDAGPGFDAASVLGVLMRTSIGESIWLNTSKPTLVHFTTAVGECLAVEAAALLSGATVVAFDEMNDAILRIAVGLVSPFVVPHVWLMRDLAGSWTRLAAIEEAAPSAGDRYAASFDLPAVGDIGCAVALVLEPAPFRP